MKRIVLLLCSLLCFSSVQAQTLFEIYKLLPDKAAYGNQSERDQMVSNYKNGNKSTPGLSYRFEIVDEKNGYLKLDGAMESLWEMCYWNLGDKKLVAVNELGSGGITYVAQFDFYILENGKLDKQKTEDIIPGFSTIYEDFFINYSEKLMEKLRADDETTTLLFRLPRTGKDITALFGNEGGDYKKFAKGDRMTLKWDNGKFKKDKIFWAE